MIADKGYESNRILGFIRSKGAVAVIPPKINRREPGDYGRELYRQCNQIERAFNKLKYWRRIATSYDRRSLYSLIALPRLLGRLELEIVDSSQDISLR